MTFSFRTYLSGLFRETPFASAAWYMRDISEGAVSLVTAPALRRRRRGAVVLNYHGVTPHVVDPAVEVSHISADLFRKQIRHIKKYYRIVSLAKLVGQLELGNSIPNNWVILTFDDGFRNNLTCALQILQEEDGLPMTVFIITDLVGTKKNHWADLIPMVVMCCDNRTLRVPRREGSWEIRPAHNRRQRANLRFEISDTIKPMSENRRQSVLKEFFLQFGLGEIEEIRSRFSSFDYLNWNEVRTLHSNGVDIGSHTCTHAYLRPDLEVEQMRGEILRSRIKIHQELGRAPAHFCYPNGGHGDFCEMSGLLLQESEYRCGLTTVSGMVTPGNDCFALKRQTLIGTMARFRNATAGKLLV